jgi:uncharacterized protein (DUF58 family)
VTSVFARTFYRFVGGNTTIPVTLGLRNIYILPTGYGLLYLTVLAAMLAGSVNYNNNLGFLLTFLLGSLGLTAMMHTYAMLYGLRLTAVRAMPAFAGTHVEIEISVAGIRRPRTGIRWFFNPVDSIVANFNPDEPARVLVRVISDHRGLFDPGWLRIACEYPLGLFHAWARVSADWNCLVYPRPVAGPVPVAKALSDSGAGDISRAAGVDDFQGLFAYQPGDSPGRIHWQSYSRGRGLYTKTFAGQAGAGLMLDMKAVKAEDMEKKLSILCFHVIQAHHQRSRYGLQLAGQSIPAGNGRGHRDRCLRALALFGKP